MAKLGVWECELNGETLTWTNGVYDMFEMPRGFRITREEILGFYSEESRRQLEDIRSRAIREGHGFTLDAKIVTAMGKERWMRITADIEHENGVPVRIFGMKQDITEDQVRRAAGRL
jgi:PAS domain-containing protein